MASPRPAAPTSSERVAPLSKMLPSWSAGMPPFRCPRPSTRPRRPRRHSIARADDDLSVRGVPNGVGDEVLEDAPQQSGVGMGHEVLGHLVDQAGAVGAGHGMDVVNEGFHEGPQVEVAPLQMDPGLRFRRFALSWRILLDQSLRGGRRCDARP
jgi:hypothetical protein